MSDLKPIAYENVVSVRFGDLDSYGHVSSHCYIDYISSSRFAYLKNKFKLDSNDLIKKGLGFFNTRYEINYKKAIRGQMDIRVSSFISKIEGATMTVSFEITTVDKEKIFSDGKFFCAIMDLKTMKPCDLPDWAEKYFFE